MYSFKQISGNRARYYMMLAFFSAVFAIKPSLADDYKAPQAIIAPIIDGIEADECWSHATWAVLDQVWDPQGAKAGTPADFTGHYKAVWTADKLYILMRVVDDSLTNWHPNEPLLDYYKNDCPEIFIDENHSGGDHMTNHNAFAYHISTLFDVVDTDVNGNPRLFNDVLTGKRTRVGTTYYWEFAVNVYTDAYKFGVANNPRTELKAGKIMGFSIAYNDSDDKPDRERMYGSQRISPPDPKYGTNVSYVNASYFGTMELAENNALGFDTGKYETETIYCYPNPAGTTLYFSASCVRNIYVVSIVGQVIAIPDGIATGTLNISDLEPGTYFLCGECENRSVRKRFIKK